MQNLNPIIKINSKCVYFQVCLEFFLVIQRKKGLIKDILLMGNQLSRNQTQVEMWSRIANLSKFLYEIGESDLYAWVLNGYQ